MKKSILVFLSIFLIFNSKAMDISMTSGQDFCDYESSAVKYLVLLKRAGEKEYLFNLFENYRLQQWSNANRVNALDAIKEYILLLKNITDHQVLSDTIKSLINDFNVLPNIYSPGNPIFSSKVTQSILKTLE